MLLQVVGRCDAPDIAADVDSVRIGRFEIEDRILGDDRTFRRGPLRPDLPRRRRRLVAQRLDAQRHRLCRHRRSGARRHRTFTDRHEQGAVLMEILRTSDADAAEILAASPTIRWQPLRHDPAGERATTKSCASTSWIAWRSRERLRLSCSCMATRRGRISGATRSPPRWPRATGSSPPTWSAWACRTSRAR